MLHCRKCGNGRIDATCDAPSTMLEVLNSCLQRISALEKEVSALKRTGPIRTCPLEWLEANARPPTPWRAVIDSADLPIDCLDTERDMCGCAAGWIARTVANTPQIRAFRTLPKHVFAYEPDGWVRFDHSMSEWLFDRVARRFLEVFQEWSQENTGLLASDKHNAIYFQRLQKITQTSMDRAGSADRMLNTIHKQLCTNNPPGVTFLKA